MSPVDVEVPGSGDQVDHMFEAEAIRYSQIDWDWHRSVIG